MSRVKPLPLSGRSPSLSARLAGPSYSGLRTDCWTSYFRAPGRSIWEVSQLRAVFLFPEEPGPASAHQRELSSARLLGLVAKAEPFRELHKLHTVPVPPIYKWQLLLSRERLGDEEKGRKFSCQGRCPGSVSFPLPFAIILSRLSRTAIFFHILPVLFLNCCPASRRGVAETFPSPLVRRRDDGCPAGLVGPAGLWGCQAVLGRLPRKPSVTMHSFPNGAQRWECC